MSYRKKGRWINHCSKQNKINESAHRDSYNKRKTWESFEVRKLAAEKKSRPETLARNVMKPAHCMGCM